MSGIQQMLTGGTYKAPGPNWPVANIGDAYGGGFFAGQINVSGTKYNLVVAPKATGQGSKSWVSSTTMGNAATSTINGPSNSAYLDTNFSSPAASFCEALTVGGYSDWYLPAKDELEVLYFYLKPTTTANESYGSNAYAVSPEPISTLYTSVLPAQTTATTNFITGGANAFVTSGYWSSTVFNSSNAWQQDFYNGAQYGANKTSEDYVRAVRRVLA